ncbi:hypothetical protein I3760_14G034600 [Carya illinoinensis]|nr:hypothetical protein I3760_14G034600 [Carya illinoinensis]
MGSREENKNRNEELFERLHKAVRDDKLNDIRDIRKSHPNDEPWNNTITDKYETVLHIAVAYGREHIVKELVGYMSARSLGMKDSDGYTALTTAAVLGNWPMVNCMLDKNFDLISTRDTEGNNLPVVMAIDFGQIEMARFLYFLTPDKDLFPEDEDRNGATLLTCAIYAGSLDIASDLIRRCPRLALTIDKYDESPILALACMPQSFPSGNQLEFWKQPIYSLLSATCCYLGSRVLDFFEGITQWYEMKKIHVHSKEVLSQMCQVISQSSNQQLEDGLVNTAIFWAAKKGIVEFVSEMLETNPKLVLSIVDHNKRNIFMLGVVHRQEKIFSLLNRLDGKMSRSFISLGDKYGNNMLHMAGMIEDSTRINQIPGAALQMQRELQWFKEIERIVHPKDKEARNKDCKTSRPLFTENHKDMMKNGEKWMKDTASSCTVVGALIVTIMFAVAFAIPGGNNQTTGFPIFLKKKLFILFIISDALSFFSSSTSVLMFLGILTSSYAEEDFLEHLPKQMIIGLLTLFCSIVTMMITFSSALLIILHEQLHIAIPLICLASVPITFFVRIQFPILKDMIISTYGTGMFDKKMKSKLI